MSLISSTVIAVGGGKGGVGKSFVASNLACAIAKCNRSVILVDADLGGANINLLFGIKYPERTLNDFLKKKVPKFSDILLPTPLPNLRLICGASDLLEIANPLYAQKQRLIREIGKLKADVVVIDIGAGASLNNLDFFNAADIGIIVTTPSPTALQNAYGFLKMAVHRKIVGVFAADTALKQELTTAFGDINEFKNIKDFIAMINRRDPETARQVSLFLQQCRYRLIVNTATQSEGERVAKVLCGVAYQYLNINLTMIGTIAYDAAVEISIRKMEPLVLSDKAAASGPFLRLAKQLIEDEKAVLHSSAKTDRTAVLPDMESGLHVGLSLSDAALLRDTKLQVQTEDLGIEQAMIVTLVFSGGRILYSRKSSYEEILKQSDVQRAVAEQVKVQHRAVLADIENGALTAQLDVEKGH